mgnify:CR=1 FL=1
MNSYDSKPLIGISGSHMIDGAGNSPVIIEAM